MRTTRLIPIVLGLLAACAGPTACSSEPHDENPADLSARLERDTGVAWAVYVDTPGSAVRFLAPREPMAVNEASPELAARAFFERYRDSLYGGDAVDELRLLPANEATPDAEDGPYLRFEHFLRGTQVRVFDVASTARFTKEGALMWVQSGFRAGLQSVPRTAAFAELDARQLAGRVFSERCGDTMRRDAGEAVATLGVSMDGGSPRLVWRVQIMSETDRCSTPTIAIDATSGEVLDVRDEAQPLWDDSPGVRYEALGEKSNIRRIDVTALPLGKYALVTPTLPVISTSAFGGLYVPLTTDTPGSWDRAAPALGAAVDAHYNTMHAVRYFHEVHGRFSTTGALNPITVVAHAIFRDASDRPYEQNASNSAMSWALNVMKCGDGDYLKGGDFLPFCSGLDVVAHELAHGITHNTSGLVYAKESGALNESFSDAMGASAENALEVRDPGRNFVIGEQITKSGRGLRNMRDPFGFKGGDLDHYSLVTPCTVPSEKNDQCGVHTKSGIPNLAFALMTAGGVHGRSGMAVAKGIDWPTARQLWFYTFTRLSPDADFKTAALAQVTEAKNRGFDVLHAVACAWYAVGVLAPELHPALAGLVCPAPGAPPPVAPGSPDCQGSGGGWFCSNSVKNSAVQCAGGAVVNSAFCADTAQSCKKTSADNAAAAVSAVGEVSCE